MKKVPIKYLQNDYFFYNKKKYRIDKIYSSFFICYRVKYPKEEIRISINDVVTVTDLEAILIASALRNDLRRYIAKSKEINDYLSLIIKQTKTKNIKSKHPWQMTREEWNIAKRPTCNIKWSSKRIPQKNLTFRIGKIWEIKAIYEFIDILPKNILGYPIWEEGCIGPEIYLSDRDNIFANTEFTIQTQSSFSISLEDAREAIILGRLLGYSEQDIAFYLIRNYIIPNLHFFIQK